MSQRRAVLIWDPNFDSVGCHWVTLASCAAGLWHWGYEASLLNIRGADTGARLKRDLADPTVEFFLSIAGFGSVITDTVGGRSVNMFARARKPIVCLCNDSLLHPWIQTALADDHPYRILLFLDHETPDLLDKYTPPRAAGLGVFDLPPGDYRLSRRASAVPPGKRSRLAVFSGNLQNPQEARASLAADYPELLGPFDQCLERLVADFQQSIFTTGLAAAENVGIAPDLTDHRLQRFLFTLERAVRSTQRVRFLECLRKHPVTFVGGRPPGALHDRAEVLGKLSQADNVKLYEQTSSLVMVPPHYSQGITERFLNGCSRGAVPISPATRRMRTFFTPGRDFLELDGDFTNFGESLAYLEEHPEAAQALQQNGQAVVDRHFRSGSIAEQILSELVRLEVLAALP